MVDTFGITDARQMRGRFGIIAVVHRGDEAFTRADGVEQFSDMRRKADDALRRCSEMDDVTEIVGDDLFGKQRRRGEPDGQEKKYFHSRHPA